MNDKGEDNSVRRHTAVSYVSLPTCVVDTIKDLGDNKTQYAVWRNGKYSIDTQFSVSENEVIHPISASNNLIRHDAVLLPGAPVECGSTQKLIQEIESYIYKYVDLSNDFLALASHYILLTWVYDAFNELPYLRLRGDYGSGKTRALVVLGSISYKGFLAAGASTVSPIFHTLDTFRGTLVLDEADFRFSDERSELVKIFNNGNVRGFPVLRTAMTIRKEFDPQAFNVYGPKIVAMRGSFEDPALESRFLTEEMGQRAMRKDIPINMPDCQKEEAWHIRCKLLMYRFRTLSSLSVNDTLVDTSLSPRLNQILVPLLSIVDDAYLRERIRAAVRMYDVKLAAERSSSIEAGVIEIVQELYERGGDRMLPLSEIVAAFGARFGADYGRPITPRLIGGVLRKRLRLLTYKSHGVYVLPITERAKVCELARRYGVAESRTSTHDLAA